jgi:hypothetical protein
LFTPHSERSTGTFSDSAAVDRWPSRQFGAQVNGYYFNPGCNHNQLFHVQATGTNQGCHEWIFIKKFVGRPVGEVLPHDLLRQVGKRGPRSRFSALDQGYAQVEMIDVESILTSGGRNHYDAASLWSEARA